MLECVCAGFHTGFRVFGWGGGGGDMEGVYST